MKIFFQYIIALVMHQSSGTCAEIAALLGTMSRDTLIRFLKQEWNGQKRLELIILAINLIGGYLILDDTPIEKPHAQSLEGLQYVYSSTLGKTVRGFCTVTLLWTDGNLRIPIGIRLWRKDKTKIELAIELISYARNQLKLKPLFILFDSWYSSKKLLKRIINYRWYFISCVRRNRNFDKQNIKKVAWRRNWKGIGFLTGNIKVFAIKNGCKYFITNRLSLTRKELLDTYKMRSHIEEFHRILKQECSLISCQVASINAQEHHQWCAIFAFAVLEIERRRLNITIYQLRKNLTKRGSTVEIPLLKKLLASA